MIPLRTPSQPHSNSRATTHRTKILWWWLLHLKAPLAMVFRKLCLQLIVCCIPQILCTRM